MKTMRALAVVVALEFVLGVVGVASVEKPRAAETPRRVVAKPRPSKLDPVIADISRFVENSRGLKFKRRVPATLLADKDFDAALLAGDGDDPGLALERTLGFIDPKLDATAALAAANDASDVVGFYDSVENELFVRGEEVTPYVRMVLAHELTHALQDQHFSLDRGVLFGADTEADIARRALAEGDAMRVEEAYFASLPPDDQTAITEMFKAQVEQARQQNVNVNYQNQWPGDRGLAYMGAFPYEIGPKYVAQLIKDGGQKALDAAFRFPPATTEQLLYPQKTEGMEPVFVATPKADGEVFAKGPMGVMAMTAFLQSQWSSGSWDGMRWGGGRYVAWNNPGGDSCVRFTVVMDDGNSAQYLTAQLRMIAELHGNTTVSGPIQQPYVSGRTYTPPANKPVNYTTCGLPRARSYQQAMEIINAYNLRESRRLNPEAYRPTPTPSYQPYQPYTPYNPGTPYYPPPPGEPYTPTTQPNCLQTGIVGVCNR